MLDLPPFLADLMRRAVQNRQKTLNPLQLTSEGAHTGPTVCAARHHPATRSLEDPVGC